MLCRLVHFHDVLDEFALTLAIHGTTENELKQVTQLVIGLNARCVIIRFDFFSKVLIISNLLLNF